MPDQPSSPNGDHDDKTPREPEGGAAPPDPPKPPVSRRLVLKLALFGGTFAGGVGIGLATNWFQRVIDLKAKKERYVAVVLSAQSIDFPIPSDFRDGFDSANPNGGVLLTKEQRPVSIKPAEDFGSVDEATGVAQQLCADPECILVIGNSNSTVTAATLEVFLQSMQEGLPPPAYILPIATATNLIARAEAARYPGLLRMVPANVKQAAIVQRLVRGKVGSQARVAIYIDEENPTYSKDLSRAVASKLRESGCQIVIEQILGPSSSLYDSMSVWTSSSAPQVIVYVGVAHHGLLLIDQVKQLNDSVPSDSEIGRSLVPIIFTDGCMVQALSSSVRRIQNESYVLSPVGPPRGAVDTNAWPTYHPIGKDAYKLASQLVASVNSGTRKELIEAVVALKGSHTEIPGSAGVYKFDASGDNTAMEYKVYNVTGGNLTLESY